MEETFFQMTVTHDLIPLLSETGNFDDKNWLVHAQWILQVPCIAYFHIISIDKNKSHSSQVITICSSFVLLQPGWRVPMAMSIIIIISIKQYHRGLKMKQLNLMRQIRKNVFQPLILGVTSHVFYLKLTVVWGKHNLVSGLLLISMRVEEIPYSYPQRTSLCPSSWRRFFPHLLITLKTVMPFRKNYSFVNLSLFINLNSSMMLWLLMNALLFWCMSPQKPWILFLTNVYQYFWIIWDVLSMCMVWMLMWPLLLFLFSTIWGQKIHHTL